MTRRPAEATSAVPTTGQPVARRLLLTILPLAVLGACGRKSEPVPPPSDTARPRRTYPPEE